MAKGQGMDALEDLRDLLEEASTRRQRLTLVLKDGEKLTTTIRFSGDLVRLPDGRSIPLDGIRSASRPRSSDGRCG
ncbi:MAG: hypothetical protein ACK4N5_22325 [Myxococcales bacterium]